VLLVALAGTIAACRSSSDEEAQTTSDGYVIEPASAIGPDAFTAPVTSDTSTTGPIIK
jgi:hypothetical protein